ncbi:hypothetical protein BRADI_5g10268v3 [Brachypodium distachyon]|uniref:Uncharacterized protein n=1 Tax=Brachypodium distachyon TaxID=15368 RepID=A0A2K2CGD8_BRADI|nr:hypothetical protein BRADI_5g10268v3 [Brachypodium distachyon]
MPLVEVLVTTNTIPTLQGIDIPNVHQSISVLVISRGSVLLRLVI